jgi:hypothetical protein
VSGKSKSRTFPTAAGPVTVAADGRTARVEFRPVGEPLSVVLTVSDDQVAEDAADVIEAAGDELAPAVRWLHDKLDGWYGRHVPERLMAALADAAGAKP